MPVIFKILFFVFIGVAIMVFLAQRNPVNLTKEQQQKMSKWFVIMMCIILVAYLVSYLI
jgi:putative copper export protein